MTGISASARRVWERLDAAAEFWLGYEQAPLARLKERGEWSPDDPGDYCGRCGESVGPYEATPTGCAACRSRSLAYDRFVRLGRYDGDLRDWILAIKFNRRWEVGVALGELLGDAILQSAQGGDAGEAPIRLIIPMPMPWARRLYRGVDHARVVAGAAARRIGASVVQPLAHRNGPPQVTLSATERLRAARSLLRQRPAEGVFGSLRTPPLERAQVVIVDDVRTTGGSLDAAARLIRPLQPASIVAAVLAVADSPGRTGAKQQNPET